MKKFIKWLDNFWYHNKWPVIIVSFFLIVGVVGISQILTERKDCHVLCAVGYSIDAEEHAAIVDVFEDAQQMAAKKNNGKSEDFDVQALLYLSNERVKELEKEAKKKGTKYVFDKVENDKIIKVFAQQLTSDETVIMLLDPDLYEMAEENDALYPVKDVLGKKPAGTTESGKGITLSESGLVEKYPAFKSLPDNTVICFKKVSHAMKLIGKNELQSSHVFQLEMARCLMEGTEK